MSRPDPAQEQGAIAATFAVMLVALLGVAMLAIDGGQLFSSRRNVLTDTDAAALAAAREMIDEACTGIATTAAEAVASAVLVSNDAHTTFPTPPTVTCTGAMGRATVTAVRTTDLAFGGLAGIPEVDVTATSVAQYGPLAAGTGLRPIAICNKDPHFLEFARDEGHYVDADILAFGGQALLDLVNATAADALLHPTVGHDGSLFPSGQDVHKVLFTKQDPSAACGAASGNWGWLDFDDGGGGATQIRDWIEFGYDQPITVGPGEDCAPEIPGETDCVGQPGAGGNSWNAALDAIHCPSALNAAQCAAQGKAFPIIVFESLVCGPAKPKGPKDPAGNCPGGSNARYDHVALLGLILRDWAPITGNKNDPSWFAFQFIDQFLTSGTIVGTPPGPGPGLVGVQLCGGGWAATVDDYCVVP